MQTYQRLSNTYRKNILGWRHQLQPAGDKPTRCLARDMSLCEATATHYSEMTAICYSDPQLWHYIDSNLLLNKAEDQTAVDLNAFSLIWFVPARSWAATFSSNDLAMSWWLADKSTPHLYNMKCLSWCWEDQAICLCVLYLNIHLIHTQLSLYIIVSTATHHCITITIFVSMW